MNETNKTLLSTQLIMKILLEIVYATSNEKESNNPWYFDTDHQLSGLE